MKFTEFTKQMSNLFKEVAMVQMDISVHGESTVLEASLKEFSFDPFKEKELHRNKMIFVLVLNERFGLREANFNNVPEQIRTAVFETVTEFISTPIHKR